MRKLFCAALLSVAAFSANAMTVNVTASNQITQLPPGFSDTQFVLDEPWFIGYLPGFPITAAPTHSQLNVDPGFDMPGISMTNANGLTWFYYCSGLKFNYQTHDNSAIVIFSGKIDEESPGTGVQCQCAGAICSTTAKISAKLMVM